jgi:polar amino acid transport system substrate-binding protein
MKRPIFLLLTLASSILIIALVTTATLSQSSAQNPAPTLVPPTPLPVVDGGEAELVLTQSGLARVQQTGRVRVGILLSAPPFGELDIRNQRVGFDADLARALGEAWGVEVRLRQVTRQTAREMLLGDEIDLLIAAQVHTRDLDAVYEFSQTYHIGGQAVMVRVDEEAASPRDLVGRRVGAVIGTRAEATITEWPAANGVTWTVETYLTLDQGYGALLNSQVDALVASAHELNALAAERPDATRVLEEALAPEPYAVVMRRGDVPLRNLVNRTLQYLRQTGRLTELAQAHFLNDSFPDMPLYRAVGDEAPSPGALDATIRYPASFVLPRLQAERRLRVAGLGETPLDNPDAPESARRLDRFYRGLIAEMADRWGVEIVYLPATPEAAVDLVARGEADLAVGLSPSWEWAERVDFTGPYLVRGLRLMVPARSGIVELRNEIGGFWIAYPNQNRDYQDLMIAEGERLGVLVRPLPVREQDIALAILEDRNADAALADSVQLLPYLESYPDDFVVTDRWYGRVFETFAVPRNDSDFRLLVEYTLQAMILDGTLAALTAPVTLSGGAPRFDIWPGRGETFGFAIDG